ncbi:MAG: ABC transporter permease subunit [Planctomycetia bacterium]
MTTLVSQRPPPPPPPRGLLAGFGPAYAWGLRLALGRPLRMLVVLGVAAALGALTGWFSVHGGSGARAGDGEAAFQLWEGLKEALLPSAVPLAALVLVAGAFSREVSERTLVFHLVRPIARRTLYLARFSAAVTVAIPVALVPPLVALGVAGLPLPASTAWALVPPVVLGVLAFGAITCLLGAWFRRGIIAGLVYVFLVDGFMSEASGTMQRLSLVHHVLSLFHRGVDADFGALSERVRSSSEAAPASINPGDLISQVLSSERVDWMQPWSAALVLLAVTAVALALGAGRVSSRDYPLKD